MKSTVDDGKRVEAFKQILEIAADQFYSIGIKIPNDGYGIRKNNYAERAGQDVQLLRLSDSSADQSGAVLQGLSLPSSGDGRALPSPVTVAAFDAKG